MLSKGGSQALEWLASDLYVSSRLMLFPNAKMAATRINPKNIKQKRNQLQGLFAVHPNRRIFSLSPLLFFFINNSAQKKSGHLFFCFLKKETPPHRCIYLQTCFFSHSNSTTSRHPEGKSLPYSSF